jgi:hypothetical protein
MVRLRVNRLVVLCLAAVAAISCVDQGPTAPSTKAAMNVPTSVQAGVNTDDKDAKKEDKQAKKDEKKAKKAKHSTTREEALFPDGEIVNAVKWTSGHIDGVYHASASIGPEGGTIYVPEADFSITFPAGAVSKARVITIVANNGPYVSYNFLPHGIKFKKPAIATQLLLNTTLYSDLVAALTAQGAYIPNGKYKIGKDGKAITVEKLKSTTVWSEEDVPESQSWEVKHFSRYILASS